MNFTKRCIIEAKIELKRLLLHWPKRYKVVNKEQKDQYLCSKYETM